MFKDCLVKLVADVIVTPITLLEVVLKYCGKGPIDFENKRFKLVEKELCEDMLVLTICVHYSN